MLEPDRLGQQRHDLAEALRDLRRAAGLSGERLAVRAQMSQSKISRIETGRVLPTPMDVECILNALEVSGELAADLVSLARAANIGYRDLRTSLRRGLHHTQRELIAMETSSRHLRFFLPTMITGLLQIPAYARGVRWYVVPVVRWPVRYCKLCMDLYPCRYVLWAYEHVPALVRDELAGRL